MTVPIPSHPPAGATDVDTAELFLPPPPDEPVAAAARDDLDADAGEVRRLDWLIVLAVLALAMAGTVALLATLWLRPGSGTLGP